MPLAPFDFLAVATWEAWCLHFGTLGDHFGTSGPPWRTMGAAEWTRGSRNRISIDFWMIVGPYFRIFLGTEARNSIFVSGFVSRSFFKLISE